MKPLTLCLLLAVQSLGYAQEQLKGINATFIFLSGGDTLDMKNPELRAAAELEFAIRSRTKIKNVYYEVTGGPKGGKPVGTTKGSSARYIDYIYFRTSLRKGDILSLNILYVEDEEGNRYKPPKTNYRFTLK